MEIRTLEFFSIADGEYARQGKRPPSRPKARRTAFATSAAGVGRTLLELEGRVARLTSLSKASSLFDDPALEIGETSRLIRQLLAHARAGIEELSNERRGSGQFYAHSEAVLSWLRTRLTAGTKSYEEALKQREASLAAKEARAAKLSSMASPMTPITPKGEGMWETGSGKKPSLLRHRGAHASACNQSGATPNSRSRSKSSCSASSDYTRNGSGTPAGSVSSAIDGAADAVSLDMSALEQGQGGQQQFWTPRPRKVRQREVTRMQSTLAELGGMFQQFSNIVAEQGELISRIDHDTEAAVVNVDEAHKQIMKYDKNIRGNRALILKTFAVIFFFIIVFGTIRASYGAKQSKSMSSPGAVRHA